MVYDVKEMYSIIAQKIRENVTTEVKDYIIADSSEAEWEAVNTRTRKSQGRAAGPNNAKLRFTLVTQAIQWILLLLVK